MAQWSSSPKWNDVLSSAGLGEPAVRSLVTNRPNGVAATPSIGMALVAAYRHLPAALRTEAAKARQFIAFSAVGPWQSPLGSVHKADVENAL